MTPTSFAFTLTMPGDERFVGAIRLLAAQAASYAKVSAEAGEALADQVQRATESAIASTGSHEAPIDFTFSGDEERVTVQIACQAAGPPPTPASSTSDGISVHWSADGTRLICRIQRPTAA
jgi:hypothetical protein